MKPNNMLKQSKTIKKQNVIRTWWHARKTASEKIIWYWMGVSSERSLIFGFPCTAANYLVSLTTNMCFRQWFQIHLNLFTPRGGGKLESLWDCIQQIASIFMWKWMWLKLKLLFQLQNKNGFCFYCPGLCANMEVLASRLWSRSTLHAVKFL